MKKTAPHGSWVAMVTPFKGGAVDYKRFEEQVLYQIKNNTDGLVISGCTGESFTLTDDERFELLKVAVDVAGNKINIMAGIGAPGTQQVLNHIDRLAKLKISDFMILSPVGNKPTQSALIKHFLTIAEKSPFPITLYNIPSRTGVTIELPAYLEVDKHDNIVATKEATGNLQLIGDIIAKTNLKVLSGDDPLTLPMLALGAVGAVSVIGNVLPAKQKDFLVSWESGDIETARRLHYEMLPLIKACFIEMNPNSVKAIMAILGRDSGELRLPLMPVSPDNYKKLTDILAGYKM